MVVRGRDLRLTPSADEQPCCLPGMEKDIRNPHGDCLPSADGVIYSMCNSTKAAPSNGTILPVEPASYPQKSDQCPVYFTDHASCTLVACHASRGPTQCVTTVTSVTTVTIVTIVTAVGPHSALHTLQMLQTLQTWAHTARPRFDLTTCYPHTAGHSPPTEAHQCLRRRSSTFRCVPPPASNHQVRAQWRTGRPRVHLRAGLLPEGQRLRSQGFVLQLLRPVSHAGRQVGPRLFLVRTSYSNLFRPVGPRVNIGFKPVAHPRCVFC